MQPLPFAFDGPGEDEGDQGNPTRARNNPETEQKDSLVEAVVFVAGAGMLLAVPAGIWALLARSRLQSFVRDFRAMNPGLWLLFLVSIATIVFAQPVLLVLLTYGFVARVLTGPTLSPLGQFVTRVLTPRLPFEPNLPPTSSSAGASSRSTGTTS